jgi:phosphoglycolate phosphatase
MPEDPPCLTGACLVFDLDGTLADTAPDLMACTNEVLAALGLRPVGVEAVRRMVSEGARALILSAARAQGVILADHEMEPLVDLFRTAYARAPVEDSRLYPGVMAALDQLRHQGARVAVCTNKHGPIARQVIAGLGLAQLVDAVVGGGDAPALKPDPRPLELAVSHAGGSLGRALMVGDASPDVGAARAAGIPVVVRDSGYGTQTASALGADAVFASFEELPGLARRLLPR